ncbi:AraC family transcriptional regulator [Dulcicalothrix desertica PCC 7102]|uniref:AraC family transcriptional regulator n=1 Tax=Dulcicalothrix desertica PCC 7102 TaxID=232991 RepID=A0A433V9I8_9CYAN|nr:AraC family transcriptional regulator [Dulcicalothrix desertica]RUT02782.1 AraC family transcriptional regulator [Dulcicalothrix desertica PCC 7102]TWH38984.1 AraC family transcriptional regulator [Dulcicalothrix desertica PCC 7102]
MQEQLLIGINHRNKTSLSHDKAVKRVIVTMHEHLDETLSLQDMAAIAALSPYHFNRIFRQITGIPPSQFLYALRLKAAKQLLLTTQNSVTDICYEVGYNSLGTFVTRFKQLVGLSPGQMRYMAEYITLPCWQYVHEHVTQHCCISLSSRGLTGQISTIDECTKPIFVGLFPTPIPQSRPLSCTVLTAPGTYHIASLPKDGQYYVFATTLTWSTERLTYFLQETPLRGSAGPVLVRNGQVCDHVNIKLYPVQLTNPPLLFALPFLFAKQIA